GRRAPHHRQRDPRPRRDARRAAHVAGGPGRGRRPSPHARAHPPSLLRPRLRGRHGTGARGGSGERRRWRGFRRPLSRGHPALPRGEDGRDGTAPALSTLGATHRRPGPRDARGRPEGAYHLRRPSRPRRLVRREGIRPAVAGRSAGGRRSLRRERRVPHLRLGRADVRPSCARPGRRGRRPRRVRVRGPPAGGGSQYAMRWLRLPLATALLAAAATLAGAADVPRRVASINLSADEILVEILPPGRLVGVTRFADDPGTSNVVGRVPPSVFRFQKADMERLVALAPDLVVVSEYTDADFLKLVERSGMRWHRMEGLDSIAGVRQAILDLGRVVGAEEAARGLVARYDATLSELTLRLAGAPRPRVLYWSGEMTAGADTAIGALIECAGARNVGREIG